jgi:hypothetical protein
MYTAEGDTNVLSDQILDLEDRGIWELLTILLNQVSDGVVLANNLVKSCRHQHFRNVPLIQLFKQVSRVSFAQSLRDFNSFGFLGFSSGLLFFFLLDAVLDTHAIEFEVDDAVHKSFELGFEAWA